MSWLRLEAAFFQNPTVIRAGWEGSIVFIAAMTMSKLHGWDGALPRDEFVTETITRHLGSNGDIDLAKGIAGCIRSGLFEEDATHYRIRNWRKFQPDPTGAERQARWRANQKAVTDVTGCYVSNGLRDGTGQDKTGQDRSVGLASPGGEPRKTAKHRRLTAKQWACVDGILDKLATGAFTQEWQMRALNLRKARKAGALGDDAARDVLDKFIKRFPAAAGEGKRKAGIS